MKKTLKSTGIFLLIVAVLIFVLAAMVEDSAEGVYVSNSFGSGYMGRNQKALDDMVWLKGIGFLAAGAGAVSLVASVIAKEPEKPNY